MNSFQIECFLRVTEHLNFAHAAEEMNISQPAITHQIQSLENELKVKLFNRTTRSVSLTNEGEIFKPEAERLIIFFKSLQNKFSPQKRGMVPLQIACTSETLMRLLPDALYNLASAEPDLHPIVRNIPMPQAAKKIHEGMADIVLGLKEELSKESLVIYAELARTPLVCVCDSTHPLSEKKETTLSSLSEFCLILYRPVFCNSRVASLQMELTKGRQTNELFYCEEITTALTLAQSGFGVCVIPQIFVPENMQGICIVPLSDVADFSFGAYSKTGLSATHKKFIKLMKEKLKAN